MQALLARMILKLQSVIRIPSFTSNACAKTLKLALDFILSSTNFVIGFTKKICIIGVVIKTSNSASTPAASFTETSGSH